MATKPKLTIGMAHFDDYAGIFMTIQSLKLHQKVDEVELVVIDSSSSDDLKTFVEKKSFYGPDRKSSFANVIYKRSPISGTAQPRNMVFDTATADVVMCIDCHVMFPLNAIKRLVDDIDAGKIGDNLYTGPLLVDNAHDVNTHFQMRWSSQMFGVWSSTWSCKKCGDKLQPVYTSGAPVAMHTMDFDSVAVDRCQCKLLPSGPDMLIPKYRESLVNAGFIRYGIDSDDEWFDIPGQGLGMFIARRDSWLGFNRNFREFGGEEGYIHKKYLNAQRKTVCIPYLQWNHRFRNSSEPVNYSASMTGRIRNYAIGWKEVGIDLVGIEREFVNSGLIGRGEWTRMIADPDFYKPPARLATNSKLPQPVPGLHLDQLYNWMLPIKRDLNDHMPTLKRLAEKCGKVIEYTKRRESTVAILAGQPMSLVSNSQEHDAVLQSLPSIKTEFTLAQGGTSLFNAADDCDLLFLDTVSNGDRINRELKLHGPKVKKYIAIHDTYSFGTVGDDKGEGMASGIARWLDDNRDWYVLGHTDQQHGMTVLSRVPGEKPDVRVWAWAPGWGAGTELKNSLKWLRLAVQNKNCSCNTRALQMDRAGAKWCLDNIDTIVKWLREEYDRRKAAGEISKIMPFSKSIVKALVGTCIRRATAKEAKFEDEWENGGGSLVPREYVATTN